MAVKITGLDGLKRMTEEASKFTEALQRYRVIYDLLDPGSVEAALRQIDKRVDQEARRYPGNQIVQGMVPGLKEAFLNGVEEEVRKARAKA